MSERSIFDVTKTRSELFFNPNSGSTSDISAIRTSLETLLMPAIRVHPTVAEIPHEDELFESVKDNIVGYVTRTEEFCTNLTPEYISDSLDDCDAVLRIESSAIRNKILYGFAIIAFKDSELYIDTICANSSVKGAGTYMIQLLTDIARHSGLSSITLNSVTSAVGFYIKQGFRCNGDDGLCPMSKTISTLGGKRKRKHKSRKSLHKKNKRSRRTYRRRLN